MKTRWLVAWELYAPGYGLYCYRTGSRNVCRCQQQSYSGLRSLGRACSTYLCGNVFGLPTSYCAVVSILNSIPFHVSPWSPLRSQTCCSNEPTLPYTRKLPMLAPFMWYRKTTQCEPVKIGDTRRARSPGCRGDDASA